MLPYHLSFASLWYLALLALVPVLGWLSYRRLAALEGRRLAALGIRSLLVALLILALAEPQIVRTSDRLAVVYLLDQSLSIPPAKRQAMADYVRTEVRRHRGPRDRAGVIVFGGDAAVEVPPIEGDVRLGAASESDCRAEHTNVAAAMRLAQAVFPEDAARRVVLVSDGNENVGRAMEQAQSLAAAGVGIDVVPVRCPARADVAVERILLPTDVRRGEPFDVRVVLSCSGATGGTAGLSSSVGQEGGTAGLSSSVGQARVDEPPVAPSAGSSPRQVRGRLVLSQIIDDQPVVISQQRVSLPPSKKVLSARQQIDEPNFYTYEARFIPDRPEDDATSQNNRATAFTHVPGRGRVLLVSDAGKRQEHEPLAERLRQSGLEVAQRDTAQMFSNLAELQAFDTVVLADVPRVSNEDTSISDEQIDILVRNTQQMGAGLVLLGGPSSFGAGGWSGSELEKAMPVDFRIRNAKVVPSGALVLVIDHSGSMVGEKVEMCKRAALESAKTLGGEDQVGVVMFDTTAQWAVPMTRARSIDTIARQIARIGAGGGTFMEPGIELAHAGLRRTDASIKHMIVLTDGQTHGSGYEQMARQIADEGITVSTVAVGPDADVTLLSAIATSGRGKFYRVNNPRALPRIFMKETQRVSRPLVFDREPVQPEVRLTHEMLDGIGPLPPIRGFVLTTKKENPLVEVSIVSPKPSGDDNGTILASWTYGLGRAAVFTSDTGVRWTDARQEQSVYGRLLSQIVRWSMRPPGQPHKFSVATSIEGERAQLVISALANDDSFLNFCPMVGEAIGPNLKKPLPIEIQQTAPGRYLGAFAARDPGSYFVTISPGMGLAPIRLGVNVPYSDEFRDQGPNGALLGRLAAMTPNGGLPGQVIESMEVDDATDLDSRLSLRESSATFAERKATVNVDTFRHDLPWATSRQDAWHWLLLLAGCTLVGDVLVRRVHVHFGWLTPWLVRARDWVLRRSAAPQRPQSIERLRSRKAEVAGELEQRRAATRFEPDTPGDTAVLDAAGQPPSVTKPLAPSPAIDKPAEESYTERLLRVKRQARDKHGDHP